MAIDRGDIVQMLRDENETLKARNQKISIRLTRHQQAFRALNQMDDTMRELSTAFDLKVLINKLLSLALHACDAENGSLILIDDETDELVPDVQKSVQWSSEIDQIIGFKTRALMCAPLYNDDTTYGAIEVVNSNSKDTFDDYDLAILRVTARYVTQALQKAEDMTLLGVNKT